MKYLFGIGAIGVLFASSGITSGMTLSAEASQNSIDALISSVTAEVAKKYPGSVCDPQNPQHRLTVAVTWQGQRRIFRKTGPPVVTPPQWMNEDHQPMAIASLSKPMTAELIRRWVNQGRLSLQSKVKDLLPGWNIPRSATGREIRLVDLLQHRSGLPRMVPEIVSGDPYRGFDSTALRAKMAGVKLHSEPGTKREYSNLGYALIAAIVEKQGLLFFETTIKKDLMIPLGMTSSLPPIADSAIPIGYLEDGKLAPQWTLNELFLAGGGQRVSPTDYLKFLENQIREKVIGSDWGQSFHETNPKPQRFWHSGAIPGQLSFMGYDLESNAGVLVHTNRSNSGYKVGCLDQLTGRLLDRIAELKRNPIGLPQKPLIGPRTPFGDPAR